MEAKRARPPGVSLHNYKQNLNKKDIQDPIFDTAMKSTKSENTAKIGLIKVNEC
jgi:hypothetical protein